MARRLHAVLLSIMQSGHINPMLELARKLLALDDEFQVSFILTPQGLSKAQAKVAKGEHIKLVEFGGEIEITPPSVESLVESLEQLILGLETPVTCLISDGFLGWTVDLANKLNTPRASFWTANAMAEVMCLYIPTLVSRGFLPVKADLEDTSLITFLPGIPPITRTQLPLSFYDDSPFLHALGKALHEQAHTVLVNTVEELEQQIVDARRESVPLYLPVGPLIASSAGSSGSLEGETSLRWLDTQLPSSVLYVAFGSYASLPFAQVENIAEGLELSKRPFLWAMRKNFATEAPEGFFGQVQDRLAATGQGLIVEWAQQDRVLEHSSVGGFLTHCGWNSVIEAVRSGVPFLCWPCVAEQNVNSRRIVEEWKIGLGVAEGTDASVSKEVLAELVRRLMLGDEGNEMRRRIQVLQELVEGASKPGGSSHRNLSSFVASFR